ncbi:MAG: T9SS type A sorting domain-containing protein [Chlorobi bacterium]|nr:T9SS type A sorting domain-containing protein [Chlorobiota bacterium]
MKNRKLITGNNREKNKGLKKIFVICLGILLTANNLSLFGQNQYFPFPTDTATWSEFCGHFETYPYPHWEYTTGRFFINGDSTIDSKEYSMIFGYYGPSEVIDTANASLMGGLREDSLKNIYFLPMFPDPDCICYKCSINPFPPEYVLYRFDLDVGDTAFIGHSQSPFVVSDIDSIQIDSYYRKKYSFSSNNRWTERYWIEGIGSSYGLFGPMCDDPFEGYVELLCYEDPITGYSKYGYCLQWYYVSVSEKQEKIVFSISTNPTNNKLQFKLNNNTTWTEIRLYNTSGLLVNTLNFLPGQNAYIMNIDNFPSGLYIAVLLDNGQIIDKAKVIINN